MTPEAQRIAIAEACGWKIVPKTPSDGKELWDVVRPDGEPCFLKSMRGIERLVPDYLNDLNAMHEAEKIFIGNREGTYISELTRILFKAHCQTQTYEFGLCHSTAAQRAEAFLRTIGKWVYDEYTKT